MINFLRAYARENRGFLILASAWAGFLLFQLLLRRYGLWVSLDDYNKALVGYKWALKPFFVDPWYADNFTWLPFHFAVTGLLIALFKDIYFAAAGGAVFFSLVSLFLLYHIARELASRTGALVAVLTALSLSSFTEIALANTSTPYFNTFMLAAFLCGIRYVKESNAGYAAGALVSLALANTVRPEGWAFSLVLLAGCVVRADSRKRALQAVFAGLTLIFPALFIFEIGQQGGSALAFIQPTVREYNLLFPAVGSAGTLLFRTLAYAETFVYFHPVLSAMTLVSFAWVWRDSRADRNTVLYRYTLLLCGTAVLLSASAVVGLYGVAYPVRFLYPWILLAVPVVACAADSLLLRRHALLRLALPLTLSGAALWTGIQYTAHLRTRTEQAAAEIAGRAVGRLFDQGIIGRDALVLSEYSPWWFYPVAIHSNRPLNLRAVLDSSRAYRERVDAPRAQQVFTEHLRDYVLDRGGNAFVLARSDRFKEQLKAAGFELAPVMAGGLWGIYRVTASASRAE